MTLTSPGTADTARAGRLAGRLAELFRNVLSGNRKIRVANDAKLFFEAARAQASPSSCIEAIVASKHGIEALQLAVRVDLSVSFLQTQTLQFLAYLDDDQLGMLANGQILQRALVVFAKPPSLWNELVVAARSGALDEEAFRVFSWFCSQLLSLSESAGVDVLADVDSMAKSGRFIEASSPETRKIGYKIQHLLELRASPNSKSMDGYAPGGRHDNDFKNFREVAVYPTTDEFLSNERPFYRRAKEVFEADMSERAAVHLDNTYRLTREDLLGELRSDWQIAQGRKSGGRSALTLRELWPAFLELGDEKARKKCSLALRCGAGLEELGRKHPGARKKWLEDNRSYLRHQAFGALYQGQQIFGFAFVDRDINGLLESPPVVILQFTDQTAFKKALLALRTMQGVMFTLVDTPVFAYEPVLERLKGMKELPLQEQLLDPSHATDDFIPHAAIQMLTDHLGSRIAGACIGIKSGHVDKDFQLDYSQSRSLINALSRKVSVIQGPPGTGKSFIGALATHFIIQNTDCKILVITYTNHAQDQFLEDLLDLGIEEGCMVRLGSKSTPRTASLLLSQQHSGYRRTKHAWAIIDSLKEDAAEHSVHLRKAFTSYLQAYPTFHDIQDHLQFSEEDWHFYGAFLVPSESDGYKKIGKKGDVVAENYLYERWRCGQGPGMFGHHALKNHADVWNVAPPLRKKYIEKWFSAVSQEKAELVREFARKYDLVQERMDTQFNENKVSILRDKRIIGCTTTAAAKQTDIIASAQPDIVIVEEAGEILESHILTALTPSVKQVILIGDHKQLRPKINNYRLTVEQGDGYDLNRSLFERLILQGHPHTTLQKQHRMHPDISLLVRELTYPDLEDGPGTSDREPIRGLDDRVIFVNHSHPELQNDSIGDRRDWGSKSSKENDFEARMVLKTVRFLAQQGYGTKNMVVLTPYLGQLRLVRDMLMDDVDPLLSDLDSHELIQAGLMTKAAAKVDKSPLRISTIDNYQGEEADIVIVSLTRSNGNGDIGFLAARERLNVLLSRARNCLIMFGNMETYMNSKKGKDTWSPFFRIMKAKNHIHDGLPVKCERHPERRFVLHEPDDFDKCCPDGGCTEQCNAPLNCGVHNCTMRCHRVDDHSKMPCPHKVERFCDRGHKLKMPCHMRNNKCRTCAQEDLETERRIKRDIKLEAERQAREAAYKRELQDIQDEIDHERRTLRYRKDEEEQKKTLAQQRADLAALKQTAERVLKAPTAQPEQDVPGSRSPDLGPPAPQTGAGSSESLQYPPDGAVQEWQHLKQFEGATSEPLDRLMGMIGLEEVKLEFLSVKSRVDTAIRQNVSLGKESFGCSMLGNPGTGKTTVARIYARFLTSLGVIPGSHFREETGASLANAGVPGCKTIIDEILNDGGGVLFIDEAYQLTSGNSFGGGAVLDYLLPEVENLNGKVVFVLAGYNKQMEGFYAHNPGLPSRFPIEMKFGDYTDEELLRIFELKVHTKYDGRMSCEDGSRGLYSRIVTRRVGRGRGREGFGNARTVENILAAVSSRQATRMRKERRQGKGPDDFLFTKEDLIGPEPTDALTKSRAWKKLQNLFGLEAVKEAVRSLVESVRQNYTRELDEQPPIEHSLNRVFCGNPGTGKTTVAKLYGAILVDLGLLSKGEVVVKNPSDFVGSALGESEKQTKGILAASLGKVLVIDEAYGLYGGQGSTSDPYKSAVIDTIVAEVQSVPGDDRCVLLLGYKDQMDTMFQNVNPGLSRRFPISSAFDFEDFDEEALSQILNLKLKQQGYHATDQAKRVAMEVLSRARNRPNFGNAGEIDIMLDVAKVRHQSRLSRKGTTSASTLEALDFDENFDRSERAETNVSMLFRGTVGQEDIIAKLQGYQETVRTMRSLGLDPKENIPFNFLFRGPPGTGKTTTAKKMGKVFYDLGFLATAEVKVCSATHLVGQYVGQTGPKVQAQLDAALGKVLFIDEAYRLADGHFAKEAMDELVDATTRDKYAKKLIIILAGYENEINRLMTTNPGLTSRFPEVIDFRALRADECVKLLLQELMSHKSRLAGPKSKKKVDLDVSVLQSLGQSLESTLDHLFSELSRQESWAGARDVGTLAKNIFNIVIQDKQGIAEGHLNVSGDIIKAELTNMLHERAGRSLDHGKSFPPVCGSDGGAFQMPPSPGAPHIKTQATTTKQSAASHDSTTPAGEKDPRKNTRTTVQAARTSRREATRDAGVSDEVWEQLQRDRQAEEQREQEYQDLLQAQRTASNEAREEIVRKLLAEEERRRREEEARKKLEAMGVCPVGFPWIKQEGGYRCGGGSHYMSDAAVMKL